ncbi:HpcH/HpaI aldolase/citrate lyase family protein [Fictibacillus terranigra]|uniref:CoA ester lyase n=1 Tax=Fictibacillus terranigra TaxID=3058424 RepID=A0ABT8E8Y3_9BACL|nr:CoA ester lyase [Fictibacillus sp. CENA-BCM004]MDN4074378.1 CoA ester lyase [Fictibacillus sp. CENA-BCM004]
MNGYRTWMFVPGSDEKKLQKAGSLSADVLIFDLEDAVSPNEKEMARSRVRKAIALHKQKVNFVRVNSCHSPYFYEDLTSMVTAGVSGIVLPKAETSEQILFLDRMISELEANRNMDTPDIKIVPLIESALGLHQAFEIASASPRVLRMAFGSVDFALDIQADLTKDGLELLYARSQIVIASKAARIEAPIDTVYVDIRDSEGFLKETTLIKQLGFQGKLVIHPDQIELVNQVFVPTQEEIEDAERLVKAFEHSLENGSGVLQLDGKMVDLPVVDRARRILRLAGVLSS